MAESLRAGRPEADLEARWYACYTRARAEKRVAAVLEERGVESFLPLAPRTSQWKDRKKVVDFPIFPSYVFARFSLSESHRVLSVPGVTTLVRSQGRPIAIPDEDLENVRHFANVLRTGEAVVEEAPCPFFSEGEWVEVTEGPFAGTRGVVMEHRSRRRVVIGLAAIGLGMPVDVEARALRAIPAP